MGRPRLIPGAAAAGAAYTGLGPVCGITTRRTGGPAGAAGAVTEASGGAGAAAAETAGAGAAAASGLDVTAGGAAAGALEAAACAVAVAVGAAVAAGAATTTGGLATTAPTGGLLAIAGGGATTTGAAGRGCGIILLWALWAATDAGVTIRGAGAAVPA